MKKLILLLFIICASVLSKAQDAPLTTCIFITNANGKLQQVFPNPKFQSKLADGNGKIIEVNPRKLPKFFDENGLELFFDANTPGIFMNREGDLVVPCSKDSNSPKIVDTNPVGNKSETDQKTVFNSGAHLENNGASKPIPTGLNKGVNPKSNVVKNAPATNASQVDSSGVAIGSLNPNKAGNNVFVVNPNSPPVSNGNAPDRSQFMQNRDQTELAFPLENPFMKVTTVFKTTENNPRIFYTIIDFSSGTNIKKFDMLLKVSSPLTFSEVRNNSLCIAEKTSPIIQQCNTSANLAFCSDRAAVLSAITRLIRQCAGFENVTVIGF
jgi:hypothetical protein